MTATVATWVGRLADRFAFFRRGDGSYGNFEAWPDTFGDVSVDIEHDGNRVGRVRYLERGEGAELTGVLTVRVAWPEDFPCASVETWSMRDGYGRHNDVKLLSVGLCRSSALGKPGYWFDGDAIADSRCVPSATSVFVRGIIERARGHVANERPHERHHVADSPLRQRLYRDAAVPVGIVGGSTHRSDHGRLLTHATGGFVTGVH